MDVAAALSRQGGTPGSVAWALLAAFTLGTWAGLLHALLVALAGRRPGYRRLVAWIARCPAAPLAAVMVGGLLILLLAWVGIDAVYSLVRAFPLDYDAVGRQIWRGAAALALPLAAAGLYLGLRWLERALARRPALAARTARAAATGLVALTLWHFVRGPFFVYFGSRVALLMLLATAGVVAAWLPRERSATSMSLVGAVIPWVMLGGLGLVGLSRPGARNLLLHESRVTGHVHAVATAWADGDGDGDLPAWLGGADCDDGDPARASWRKEIPGNGIDDNCRAGDAPPPPRVQLPPGPPPKTPPLVLITIDTVRVDRLELYGAERPTMPALARLGAHGRVYERAYAPANHTFFSVTALLAGQSTERMLEPGEAAVPQLRYTFWLPDALGKLGYHRIAVDPPLLHDGKLPPEQLRFDEIVGGGFDRGGNNRGTTARQAANAAIRWLEGWDERAPVFLWIHFMDPHAVHESPVRFAVEREQDAYDNELSWVDLHLGRVLAAVEHAFEGRAYVVVASDHGEQFGEYGGHGHGFSLREVEVRVPLVLAGPTVSAARVPEPVSLLRVPATMLGWLGYGPQLPGAAPSLMSDAAPPVVVENPAFLWNERRMEAALIEGPHKLVLSRTTGTALLFDLERDPREREDLSAREPQRREAMLERLREHLEHAR